MLTRIVHQVEMIFDRLKYRLGARLNRRVSPMIMPYVGYGTNERIFFRGRVLEDNGIGPVKDTDGIWRNIVNMYRRFESDEIPQARLMASFRGNTQEIVADEEGFFEAAIELDEPLPTDLGWGRVTLELVDPKLGKGETHSEGRLLIVSPQAEYGIISDIDDTVVHTGVPNRLKMARTVFLKNAYSRKPILGIRQFYRALQAGRQVKLSNPLFYVSSSPWNLYDHFQELFQIHDIPIGPITLRNWGIERDSMMAIKTRKYKLAAICEIMDRFPYLPFILIGDSGEEDPEVYREVIRLYPGQILIAYIRMVRDDPSRFEQIRLLAKEAEDSGSALLLAEDPIEMAKDAAQRGLINLSPGFQPIE
jgi:phosphatidate phosphatase APP1